MSLLKRLLGQAVEEAQISEAARVLADSLRTQAGDWALDVDGYYLRNAASGASIWVANEDYALKVTFDGNRWVPSGAERAIIWDAAKALMDAKGHATARRLASRLNVT